MFSINSSYPSSNLHIPMEMVLRQMDLWYRTPLGAYLLEAEYVALTPYLQDCFGKHLLQIGGPGEVSLFRPNVTFHAARLSPEQIPVFNGPSVCGSFEALPFLPGSIDIMLLPHVLEFVVDPAWVLAQSYQVLAPEGRILVLGFNPWSLWGLYRCFQQKSLPWRGHFHSVFAVKQWLKRQGFVLEKVESLFFRPPLTCSEHLQHWLMLEALGRLLWADNGGVYLIVARKRVAPLVPIREPLRYVETVGTT